MSVYEKVNPNPNFPEMEQEIINKWKKEDTFKKTIRGEEEFVFYDGPPFANGLPHYGHILTGYKKDLVARFQTMLGKKVDRVFGWDCHGLPAEMGAEKELGISGKVAIEKYGIDKFNAYCRQSVMQYTSDWRHYVNRQARWVDFDNDYKTMDLPYMESVIWAFKQLYDKGLIYESYRVMPYSWACETPVSDFETRMDNSYREKVSKAATVKLKLREKLHGYDASLLIWTTTPWTLPSNLAAAVNRDIDYVIVEHEGEHLVIAESLLPKFEKELGSNLVARLKGAELVGLKYAPLFDYFKDHPNSFVVLHGDFVSIEDGTGIVHMAPGFGEDDQVACKANNIELVCPVDSAGKFTFPVTDYEGMQVFETNDPILKVLKDRGLIVRIEQYIHNYPHCWRTDTPLIYRAVPSYYVKVTDIKDKMIANNQKINWIPSHVKNGIFGKWLENARDWSISRNRYWGCPIPIWVSDDPKYPHMEVYGSIAELEAAFGVKVEDLHRPFIDTLVKPNPSDPTGKSSLRRVSDVFDCWFESGSMPFAQWHYPFENKERFEKNFPADFIVEYIGQTRGWFYTLIVLSTALFDSHPFKNVVCHGVLLGDDGQKLSKRLKNYPDPNLVFDTIGADPLRWYLVSSTAQRGQELRIEKDARGMKEAARTVVKPIWNAFNFFVLYANADEIKAVESYDSVNIMDQYILSKVVMLVEDVKKAMLAYDFIAACGSIESFIEVLNNWYIRRTRERFWQSEKDESKVSAYNTLYTVLINLCKIAAPLLPLTLEKIYNTLRPEAESVHLELYPEIKMKPNMQLIADMEKVRAACTSALFLRNELGIRVRQPLQYVTFIGVADHALGDDLRELILDEINVKEWRQMNKSEIANYANYKLQINFPVLGKRLPSKVKDIIAAQKKGEWKHEGGEIVIAGEKLEVAEYNILLDPKPEYAKVIAALPTNDGLVYLDTEISPDLKLEGIARDVVRAVQQIRKDMDLNIADRINIEYYVDSQDVTDAITKWSGYIAEQVLARTLAFNASIDAPKVVDLDEYKLSVKVSV